GRVAVLVDFADRLMREEVPMELGPVGDAGTFRGASLPLLHRGECEVPAVRSDLAFLPPAVRIDPRVLPADGHARIPLSRELLEVVVGHVAPPPKAGGDSRPPMGAAGAGAESLVAAGE